MAIVLTEFLYTAGSHIDEPAAWNEFDEIIGRSGAFRVYREVHGEYLHPRVETEEKKARIDRILVPTDKLLEAGWKTGGAIGVEGKKSDSKCGPLISQAIDYSRCVFKLERKSGLLAHVMLRWVFIYPVISSSGDIASIMAQNRIGSCSKNYHGGLNFCCAGTTVIEIDANGSVKAKDTNIGNKRGSR